MNSKHTTKIRVSDLIVFIYISSLFELYGSWRPLVEIGSIGLLAIVKFSHRGFVIKSKFYFIWGIMLCLLCGFSALYGEDTVGSLYGTRGVVECFIVGIVVANCVESDVDIYKYFEFAVYGACLLFVKVFVTVPLGDLINRKFPASINANSFGLKMSFCLLIAVFLIKQAKIRWWRIPVALLTIGALLSGSKKAVIIAVLGIAIMLTLLQDQWLKKIVFLIFGIAFVWAMYWLTQNNDFLYNVIGYRLYGLISMLDGTSVGDASSRERVFLIEMALGYWKERPFWGYGINSFGNVIGYSAYGSQNIYSHCNYTELLFGIGLVGTAWYYALFAYLLPKMWKCLQKNALPKLLLTILILIAFVDIGLVSYGDEFIQFLLAVSISFCTLKSLKEKRKQLHMDKNDSKYDLDDNILK